MMNEEWFIIKDLKEFINASRRLVFQNFGSKSDDDFDIEHMLTDMSLDDETEMDNVLSYNEAFTIAKSFIKRQINKKTKEHRYILNEDVYMSIITALNDRMISNILNNLVNKGLIETAYDDQSNDFVFWVKDEHKKNIDKSSGSPETD